MGTEDIPVFCRLCMSRCSIIVAVEGGKVVRVRSDPEAPLGKGFACAKGRALPDLLNHPERLTFPLRRRGQRGEGSWERISWQEALGYIAEKLGDFRATFGPECVAIGMGDPKGLELAFAQRFASVFGTPNISTPGHICHIPGELASIYTFGSACVPDDESPARCIVVWGNNFLDTHAGTVTAQGLKRILDSGGKFIVIDPRKTVLSSRASLWLKPRPGSDGALALGMIKVILEEELYNQDFVNRWTVGFDKLLDQVRGYSPQHLEEITWVSWPQMAEVARIYAATKPAAIQWGNALEHTTTSFQTCRAVSILRALTGNVDVPGGDLLVAPPPVTRPGHFILLREFPRKPERTVGSEFKLALRSAFIPRQSLVRAILEEKPYPIKAALLFGTNPLLTNPGASETLQALMKLELLVASDLFMTPSAALADIVLPAATTLEFDEVAPYPSPAGFVLAYPKIAEPPGECWPDIRIINELGKKLGLGQYFWEHESQALDFILKPSGLTFAGLKEKRVLRQPREYRKYEKEGFKTPSGKAEIYSSQLEEMGYGPLPPLEAPASQPDESYPLLLTNAKSASYCHSAHRNIPALRQALPEPVVELSPATAAKCGLAQGDWVVIETKRGKIRQKLSVSEELDPRVVVASYGWPSDANINLLTSTEPPYDPAIGALDLRGLPCRVYKA